MMSRFVSRRFWAGFAALAAAAQLWAMGSAQAVVVELKDVAPDRIQRQQAEFVGQIPLPGTPNLGQFNERLKERTLIAGSAIFIRVFKAESELEVWMQRGDRFEHFATYPICHWSGTLGPKINEGDKQSPEGIYTVSSKQLHLIGRHPRSLNLGFPNALDRQFQRTGSYILIHGGCSSVGCFAMTNPVIEEVFSLAQTALKGGQDAIQVHVFPFRMTEDKLKAYALNEWYDFWRNLKDAYDSFERTRLPPKVTICEGRYWVEDGQRAQEVAAQSPLAVCGASRQTGVSQNKGVDSATVSAERALLPLWAPKFVAHPSTLPSPLLAPMVQHLKRQSPLEQAQAQSSNLQTLRGGTLADLLSSNPVLARSSGALSTAARQLTTGQSITVVATSTRSQRGNQSVPRNEAKKATTTAGLLPRVQISCSLALSSCRRWAALQQTKAVRQALDRSTTQRARVSQRDGAVRLGNGKS
ncbi:MAG: L,D-transpeptidase family protein [Hyphomicrobiaceae bacterium]